VTNDRSSKNRQNENKEFKLVHFVLGKKLSRLKHWPIRKKMSAVIVLAVWLGSVISSALLITYDRNSERANLVSETEILLNILAQSTSAALAFLDQKTAVERLSHLEQNVNVNSACLYDIGGVLFVSYKAADDIICQSGIQYQGSPIFSTDHLTAMTQIKMRERVVGYIELTVSLKNIQRRIKRNAGISILIQFVSCIIAYLLTVRLQRSITNPLLSLAQTAETISENRDYSLRANLYNDDEIGQLVKSFNAMLHEIQGGNLTLVEALAELKEAKQKSDQNADTAESKAKSIRGFFSGAAHDLRQPLHAMGLFLDALKEQEHRVEQHAYFDKLNQSVENLTELFNDLLDVSKLEERFNKPKLYSVSIKAIFENIRVDFELLAKDKGLKFAIFYRDDCYVKSDAQMLERILRNLVSNAIRYTEQGGILIAARNHRCAISIEVWDTGRGISKDKQASIFEEFQQVDETDVEMGGYGLGLSIVKRLCALLDDHNLSIRSDCGRGSRFKILVGAKPEDIKLINEDTSPTIVDETSPPVDWDSFNPLFGKTILIIDDAEDVQEALTLLLKGWGMSVFSASGPNQAMALLDDSDVVPDLVISDFNLESEISGDQLISMIRNKLRSDVPAIIISGESSEESKIKIKSSGIDSLTKPVKSARLRSLINYTLD